MRGKKLFILTMLLSNSYVDYNLLSEYCNITQPEFRRYCTEIERSIPNLTFRNNKLMTAKYIADSLSNELSMLPKKCIQNYEIQGIREAFN